MSLHVHSEFSSLDGWSTVDEIADRMVDMGCPYCGLTDHGVVAGHIEFDKAMRSRGLNPVFGCELYHGVNFDNLKKGERDQAHLIALAMTDEGLRNLWRLVNCTADREKFHHVGRVSNDDIVKYKEGIMFTSACPLGHVAKGLLRGDNTMLNWYLDTLKDNFRLELTTYPGDAEWGDMDSDLGEVVTPQIINELKVEVAEERGVPLTYGDDGHYARPDQYEYHDMYLAAQTRESINTPVEDRKMWHPKNAVCIKDEKMVREALHYLPDSTVDEVLFNTAQIGTTADAHLPNADKPHLPVFVPEECPWIPEWHELEPNAEDLFVRLVEEGIDRHYQPVGSDRWNEAMSKAVHEMEVLIEARLEHFFLWSWDVVEFCRIEDIAMGPGRGSSAGSIVAYALGITDVDPLHYELYFERFWNAGRTEGFPDIDSDFARSRRGDIREYLIDRLGEHRVCSIGTITRMKPISVIEKLGMACEISHIEQKELKDIVKRTHDIDIHGPDQIGWNPEIEPGKVIYVREDVGEDVSKWIGKDTKRATFVGMCEHACSRNSNYGIHPSGIVISDIDLDDYAPAALRGGKNEGIPATQFPMALIDKLKLFKLDILGLKTLDTLAEFDKLIAAKGDHIEWSGLDREEHAGEMWDLLEEGFVSGVFQVETHAGKALCEKLKPRSVEELGVLVALNRPGPDPQAYIARKEGRVEVTYPHPMLEEILKPTYGLFVYQEQIIRFMGALGYSLNDADAMRKILGKKQPEKLSDLFKGFDEWDQKGFLQVAMEKGFTKETAQAVWKDLERFASYSFNKSHSIAYAIIGFRCLYAKDYAPQEFYIACLRTVEPQKRAELTPSYIKEARRAGIKVLPPDIRFSKAETDVHDGHIYFGFGDIKGVASGGTYLVKLRDEMGFDVSSPEALIDQLEEYNKAELKKRKDAEAQEGMLVLYGDDWKSPKQLLNAKKIELVEIVGAWDEMGDGVSLKEKQAAEEELLNVILTDNTEEIFAEHEGEIGACDSWEDALTPWDEKEDEEDRVDSNGDEIPATKRYKDYRLPAIITSVKPTKVKASGKAMGIVTIEFGRHELTFACFSNKWPKSKALFKPHNVGIFTIRHAAPTGERSEGWHYERGRLLTS